MRTGKWSLLLGLLMLAVPPALQAQEPTTVIGQVVSSPEQGSQPLTGVQIQIEAMNLGTITDNQGRYMLIVPAARADGQEVTLTASRIGLASRSVEIVLEPGTVTQNFVLMDDPLRLEEIIVTGQGTRTTREKLGVTVTSVNADEVINSQESNLVAALAGKAPNVTITQSSGDPGAGAYIQIRGANSIYGGTQPLWVVDGVPVNNDSYRTESAAGGTVAANRLVDLNPNDIANIEILKGAAAGAIYGSRAAAGVVLVTTKSGQAGGNRVSWKTSVSVDEVNQIVPLQTSFGQTPGGVTSWGPRLPEGTPTFNHNEDIFRTGSQVENNLTISGGTDRTTYYLSLGRNDHTGVIDGNSEYDKTMVRLKASHGLLDNLVISGNFAYTDAEGDLIQQGSNISGLLLGALRTPPEFNNADYLTETGLHRSYRNPNPTTVTESRGFDNPFFVMREHQATTEVGRTIGNIETSWDPVGWLNVNYLFGVDYANDNRLTLLPKSSSGFPQGTMNRANFTNRIIDSNLVLTATRTFNEDVAGSLAFGQNFNEETFKRYEVDGNNLILGTDQLDYTVDQIPNETYTRVRTSGYFTQANLDLWDQLFLTGAVRLDGSSTFGSESENWYWYPKFTAAWNFTDMSAWQENDLVSFGKLRFAWGVTGKQPPAYSNVTGFQTDILFDSWLSPNGLYTIYGGNEGVYQAFTQGNQAIEPERSTGFDAGIDLAFLSNRVNLGVTYYDETTEDVILDVPVPLSTGFTSRWANGAEIENSGWEATLDVVAMQREDFSWSIDAHWSTNESCVSKLGIGDPGAEGFQEAEFISLGGFTYSEVGLHRPERDANGNITKCYAYNTFYGDDFVRFGRGLTVGGVSIDDAFPDAPAGAVYIGADGFPRYDGQLRPLADMNPDYTYGFRTTFTFLQRFSLSALIDGSVGAKKWNGTKGALYHYGTHKDTEPWHGAGVEEVFGEGVLSGEQVAGPGAGESVTIDGSWINPGLGGGFTGPSSQFVEDADWVKLRDITLGINLDDEFFSPLSVIGVSSADILISGRNLATWTDYEGVDPESNLWGQGAARGIDYFHNPRTRSWVFTVQLNR